VVQDLRKRVCSTRSLRRLCAVKKSEYVGKHFIYSRVVTISEDAGFQSGIMEAIASQKTGLQMSNKMKRE
jgi:hypothetical protein